MEDVIKLFRQFQNDTLVTITLEHSQETFSVQRAWLCNVSEYFRKALSSGFEETSSGCLKLPGADLESVQLFVYWLCNHGLPNVKKALATATLQYPTVGRTVHTEQYQNRLVRLWAFGDAFAIPKLQNAAMESLIDLLGQSYLQPKSLELIFEVTSDDSPLRTLGLRAFIMRVSKNDTSPDCNITGTAFDALGATPGIMEALFEEILESKCGKIDCWCDPSCYDPTETHYNVYRVSEE